MSESLPFLTAQFPGVGGSIKNRPEDFFVQEVPLYEPSGEGEHVYCEIQKVGLPTFDAIDIIAKRLNVSTRDIGYAGMKDAQAVTRQTLSIWGTTPELVMGLRIPEIQVQWAARHVNKLRMGHLAGNRFAVKIRDVGATDVVKIQPVMAELSKRGMPNYFGEQRFGRRGDNHLLGAAYVRGDDAEVLKLLLGTPISGVDDGSTYAARAAFDSGDFEKSMKLWPRRCGMERRILARFIKTSKPGAAVRAVDDRIRRLWVSAIQSAMFNEVAADRVRAGTIDKLLDGDLAWKQDNGAVFKVESAATEQPRCDAFEVSPTGPLVGYRMTAPEGEALRVETEAMQRQGLKPDEFRRAGDLKVKGARRPLRVQPTDIQFAGGMDEHGAHITVAFTLPPGSFATVLLRELMKVEV